MKGKNALTLGLLVLLALGTAACSKKNKVNEGNAREEDNPVAIQPTPDRSQIDLEERELQREGLTMTVSMQGSYPDNYGYRYNLQTSPQFSWERSRQRIQEFHRLVREMYFSTYGQAWHHNDRTTYELKACMLEAVSQQVPQLYLQLNTMGTCARFNIRVRVPNTGYGPYN